MTPSESRTASRRRRILLLQAVTGRRICSQTEKSASSVAPVSMPIAGGAAGHGGMAHAANEYFVIEGAGKVYGMAGAEKSVATILYNFAHSNGAPAAAPSAAGNN